MAVRARIIKKEFNLKNLKNENLTIAKLTGLSDKDLAEVLSQNPRAYMAVKGAVAEKHLENELKKLEEAKKIQGFRKASGDFDKDFYVILKDKKEISLECKNVEVLKLTKKENAIDYFKFIFENNYSSLESLLATEKFLVDKKHIKMTNNQDFYDLLNKIPKKLLDQFIKLLPQDLKESGIPRYEFSASQVTQASVLKMNSLNFLNQFNDSPLTIDFQRTRNSTAEDGDNRKQRLYGLKEIDVVGACLFSRTMKWEFVYGKSIHFEKHAKYKDRYSNRLTINPETWSNDLLDCLKIG